MARANPSPLPSEPRRFSIRLPKPLWIGVATLLLVLVTVALRIAVPIYRQRAVLQKIALVGGSADTSRAHLEWLPEWVDDQWTQHFDSVTEVALDDTEATDGTLAQLSGLTSLRRDRPRDQMVRAAPQVEL